MVDGLTFRTTDNTRWGAGYGADLPAALIDINFWILYTQIVALQSSMSNAAGIADIIVSGTQFSVELTNHVILGPYPLPIAQFNWKGNWAPNVTYNINDVFTVDFAVYLVIWPVTNSGAAPFWAGASDGLGHFWYANMITAPPSEIPTGGVAGQFLMGGSGSPAGVTWANITRNLAVYDEVPPMPLEVVLRYTCPEVMSFPQGLIGSAASCTGHSTSDEQAYEIYWNGANVGSINFNPSPQAPSFYFPHEVLMEPGDVLTVVAPSVPDPHLYGISFTLVGILEMLPIT